MPEPTNHCEQVLTPVIIHKKYRRALEQAAFLQQLAFNAAYCLKLNCTNLETGQTTMDVKTAVAVQKLIGAWDTAADRRRILLGKGLPKTQDSGKVKRKTRLLPAPEPVPTPQPIVSCGVPAVAPSPETPQDSVSGSGSTPTQ